MYKNNNVVADFTVIVTAGVTELTTQNKSIAFLVSDKISFAIKTSNNSSAGAPFIINLKLY
jgi:hypothetical protein